MSNNLSDRSFRLALLGYVPDDDPEIVADMRNRIEQLETAVAMIEAAAQKRAAEVALSQTCDHPEWAGNWNEACEHIAAAITKDSGGEA